MSYRERTLSLLDIVRRADVAEPWREGEKIPWDDPDFSRRMLAEHLSQEHGMASRQLPVIEQQVSWLHREILGGGPGRVLDLGCGPGLYTSALARLGHECVGIDFSPASIAYARQAAGDAGLACQYVEADVRSAEFGRGFSLAMMVYGEFNVFRPDEAGALLRKARESLIASGRLVLEAHTHAAVKRIGTRGRGTQGRSWSSAERGLFSDRPYIQLYETFWDEAQGAATERYYIVDAESGFVDAHAQTMQAYADAEYEALLAEAGLELTSRLGSLEGAPHEVNGDLVAMVAEIRREETRAPT